MRLDEIELSEKDFIGKLTPKFNELLAKYKKQGYTYTDLMIQLAKGIKVEQEHTEDMALAREIALDHLAEFPDYYDRLKKAEKN